MSASPITTRPRPDLKDVPLASLHIGGGAHSDADNVGVGNRYISFRNRVPGDTRYGNAIEPIQDAGQVYDLLMRSAAAACTAQSNQPRGDTAQHGRRAGATAERGRFHPRRHQGRQAALRHGQRARAQARRAGRELEPVGKAARAGTSAPRAAPREAGAAAKAGCQPMARPSGERRQQARTSTSSRPCTTR